MITSAGQKAKKIEKSIEMEKEVKLLFKNC